MLPDKRMQVSGDNGKTYKLKHLGQGGRGAVIQIETEDGKKFASKGLFEENHAQAEYVAKRYALLEAQLNACKNEAEVLQQLLLSAQNSLGSDSNEATKQANLWLFGVFSRLRRCTEAINAINRGHMNTDGGLAGKVSGFQRLKSSDALLMEMNKLASSLGKKKAYKHLPDSGALFSAISTVATPVSYTHLTLPTSG